MADLYPDRELSWSDARVSPEDEGSFLIQANIRHHPPLSLNNLKEEHMFYIIGGR
jgi:hypothetical protein